MKLKFQKKESCSEIGLQEQLSRQILQSSRPQSNRDISTKRNHNKTKCSLCEYLHGKIRVSIETNFKLAICHPIKLSKPAPTSHLPRFLHAHPSTLPCAFYYFLHYRSLLFLIIWIMIDLITSKF